MVEYLLGVEALKSQIQYTDSHGDNFLHLASKFSNPEIFQLLVPHFQEGVHQPDRQGHTPLVRVIMNPAAPQHRVESVRTILLQSGCNWNEHLLNADHHTLKAAMMLGDLEMVRLLLDVGKMDPNIVLICDDEGRPCLQDEVAEDKENIPQILELLSRKSRISSVPSDPQMGYMSVRCFSMSFFLCSNQLPTGPG